MRINHNISAINAHRQLSSNQGATSKSLQKLSSGLRINSAADDAAGLAISEKMRTQIRGLEKAQSNAQDSISLIQTAEGALQEVSNILQRMRELSVQSMNGILSETEKDAISAEMTQLRQEVDRIAETSKFNNTYLLKGTLGMTADTATSSIYTTNSVTGKSELMNGVVGLDVAAAEKNTTYTISLGSAAGTTSYVACANGDEGALEVIADKTNVAEDGVSVNLSTATADANAGETFNIGDTVYLVGGKYTATDPGDGTAGLQVIDNEAANTAGAGQILASNAGGATVGSYVKAQTTGGGTVLQIKYTDISGKEVTATSTIDPTSTFSGFIGFTDANDNDSGIKIQVEDMDLTQLDGVVVNTSDGGKTNLHIGANSVDAPLKIEIPDLRARALGIEDLSIVTTNDAKQTLDKIDNALTTLSSARGNLGAYQNRLEYTLNSLAASAENLTAAESRIRDVDMAKEMMNFTQANILNQSATAMLAQANQQPQTVLQLLQGL